MNRRDFLTTSGALGAASILTADSLLDAAPSKRRPRIAAIYTVMTHRSHAHVILEKFLRTYLFKGKRINSPVDVVSIFSDQNAKDGDMTRGVSREFKIPVFKTIAEALTNRVSRNPRYEILTVGIRYSSGRPRSCQYSTIPIRRMASSNLEL